MSGNLRSYPPDPDLLTKMQRREVREMPLTQNVGVLVRVTAEGGPDVAKAIEDAPPGAASVSGPTG